MEAATPTCPQCGAPGSLDAVSCAYCRAALQTVSCPSCFGRMFFGSRFCPHCGGKAASPLPRHEDADCPRCGTRMAANAIGGLVLDQCGSCGGVWMDQAAFRDIVNSREAQAAIAGPGVPSPKVPRRDPTEEPLVYRECPRCRKFMNRVNFAGISGVVLDICKDHGVWFDKDELRETIEFIRAGGLEQARKEASDERAFAEHLQRLKDGGGRESRVMAAFASIEAEGRRPMRAERARTGLERLVDKIVSTLFGM